MKKLYYPVFAFFLLLFICPTVTAQKGVNYNDVGIIMNLEDSTSIKIANYFVAKRNIPAVNVIQVRTDTAEEITDSTFVKYRKQITDYLSAHHLADSLNYLVTTKGCPLKIKRDNESCNACAESELMLSTPGNESYIGDCITLDDIDHDLFFTNPYFDSSDNFSQKKYAIFLVTRLDAYTIEQVYSLIDRSGPNTYVNQDSVLFVLDQAPKWSAFALNYLLGTADSIVNSRGFHSNFNEDDTFVINQKNVLGYWSWGSNDTSADHFTTNAKPHNTWTKASIAETGVSTGGRSFQPNTPYGQSLVADLLAEGVAGTKGYVYEPFTVAIAYPDILFDRYTNLDGNGMPKYNLAESYFAASRMIGWMDVVIGDPKTSITIDSLLGTGITAERKELPVNVFPNPATQTIYISAPAGSVSDIFITDMAGRQFVPGYSKTGSLVVLDVNSIPGGLYLLHLQQNGQAINRKVVILK